MVFMIVREKYQPLVSANSGSALKLELVNEEMNTTLMYEIEVEGDYDGTVSCNRLYDPRKALGLSLHT